MTTARRLLIHDRVLPPAPAGRHRDRNRRYYDEYRRLSGEWAAIAEKLMRLAVAGRIEEAVGELGGREVEYGARPIEKDGAIVGAVISFRDVTERRRVEAESATRASWPTARST